MSIIKYLLETQITLSNGEVIIGSITTIDAETYRFLSNANGINFYVLLKRTATGWEQISGSVEYGKELVTKLGKSIERFMKENPFYAERLNWIQ